MTANKTKWVRLGDYIEEVDERNDMGEYSVNDVRGISIDKIFIDTKANMEGVSVLSYKIVKPSIFVYVADTSRRGDKIALACNNSKTSYLISSIYTTFKTREELLPEYLYLLLSRSEFDRYARFNSWGSARETFDWNELCRVRIPLPPIEVQKDLVETYKGVKRLAVDNEALIDPLTEVCNAFIVDCKRKYPLTLLGGYIEEVDERNGMGKYSVSDVRGISTDKKIIETKANMEGVSVSSYKIVEPSIFVYVADTSRRGDKIALAYNNSKTSYLISSIYTTFKTREELLPEYLYLLLSRSEFDRYARFNSWGSVRETFSWEELCRVQIPLPPLEVQQSIVNVYHCIEEAKSIARDAREQLSELCPALVQHAIHN